MTAQIGDKFYYKGNRYTYVSIENELDFHPRDLGLTPFGGCTCCWRGHWCEYQILPEGLYLENLFICTKGDVYPDACGVKVFEEKAQMGCSIYPDLHRKIPYSGKIRVGTDFLPKYYIHGGYQRAWAYETLLEFEFRDGKLVRVTDHSHMGKVIREQIEKTGCWKIPYWDTGVMLESFADNEKKIEISDYSQLLENLHRKDAKVSVSSLRDALDKLLDASANDLKNSEEEE